MIENGDRDSVKSRIRAAFAHTPYPGDWCLRGSSEGDEPYLLEKEFKGKEDWQALDAEFLDQAPDGYGSALSFFSDEAFHFYLPAYLMADIDGLLSLTSPSFHLTHGLRDADRRQPVNPARYGERTWYDQACFRFSMFNREEAAAIVAYLELKRELDEFERPGIDQALKNYWYGRVKDPEE
jgi:hypothetical protein